jgi:hypothetical protein
MPEGKQALLAACFLLAIIFDPDGGLAWLRDRDQWRALVNTGNFLSGCTIGGFSRRARLHE